MLEDHYIIKVGSIVLSPGESPFWEELITYKEPNSINQSILDPYPLASVGEVQTLTAPNQLSPH